MYVKRVSVGFTIVELLIAIVVIGILASLSFASFNAVQAQARTTVMRADIASIEKVYDLYRITNGSYPSSYALATSTSVISSALSAKMVEMTGTAQSPCPTTKKSEICLYAFASSVYSEYALVYWNARERYWTNFAVGIGAPDSGDRWRVETNYGSGEFPIRP